VYRIPYAILYQAGIWPQSSFHEPNHLKPHPLIGELSIVKALNQQMSIQTENCPQCQEWSPYKVRGVFPKSLCAKREMTHPVTTKAFVQPSTTAVMCCHLEGDTQPPPPVPPLCWESRSTDVSKSGSDRPHAIIIILRF